VTRPLVLLDVDGVLNVLSDSADGWPVLAAGWAVAEGRRYPINWAPDVIDALRRWLDEGVEVQWLTTWGHDANDSLRHLLGLPELPVAGTYRQEPWGAPEAAGDSHASVAPAAPDPLTGQWWKYDVVQRLLREHPGRTLIWVDDELHLEGTRFRRWADEHPSVIPIGPDGRYGLTPDHLAQIDELLRRATGVS
jgi:hypothetical protein